MYKIKIKKKMTRNTTGGKNFKKFKTGSEGFREKASREAVDDMIDLFIKRENKPETLTEDDREALKFMVIGRVITKLGHGRMSVYCHDSKTRQCKIRGLLRKKGKVFIDKDSFVVVSLREAESSDSEGETAGLGNTTESKGTSDIIGCFNDRQVAIIRKTNINPNLFLTANDEKDDLFDRTDIINEGKNTIEEFGDDDIDKI